MKQKGNWMIESSTKVYENPWISVYSEKGKQPDGKEGEHTYIVYKPGVAVLPMDEEGNVYLIREFRYAIGEKSVEAVAGGIEEGDTPLEGAKKELREELGITATEWEELGVYHPLTETVFTPSTFFIARGLSFEKQDQEGTEDIEIVKMKLSDAVKKVISGEINFALAGLLILIANEKYSSLQNKK